MGRGPLRPEAMPATMRPAAHSSVTCEALSARIRGCAPERGVAVAQLDAQQLASSSARAGAATAEKSRDFLRFCPGVLRSSSLTSTMMQERYSGPRSRKTMPCTGPPAAFEPARRLSVGAVTRTVGHSLEDLACACCLTWAPAPDSPQFPVRSPVLPLHRACNGNVAPLGARLLVVRERV